MMLLVTTDENGRVVSIERQPDLPEDYSCPEWLAYEAACKAPEAAGAAWTEEQAATFAAYYQAMQERLSQ